MLEIDGKRYPLVGAGEATLADLIALRRQTGLGVGELQALTEGFADLEGDELQAALEANPSATDDMLIAMGITVWLSRRRAGEDLTLDEACAFPLDKIRHVAEPGDKKEPKKKAKPDPQ